MKRTGLYILPFVAIALMGAAASTSCDMPPPQNNNKNVQAEKAAKAAEQVHFTANAEIDNIKRRLELTSNPEQIGFVLLLNDMGQPVYYAGVKGKITSGGKRLTPPEQPWTMDHGQYYGTDLGPAPSDEGTWGTSGEYIYFWTTEGQYVQWNGSYLYSDQPFRLKIEPLAVSLGNADKTTKTN